MVLLDMTYEEIRRALVILAQVMITQENKEMGPRMNSLEITMTPSLRDFVRMNPPIILGYKVGDDFQALLNEVYKIVHPMEVTSGGRQSWLQIN